MKALLIDKAGSLDDVRLGEVPVPSPGPGQVLIEVRAAGINPADWKIVERGAPGWRFPKVAGLDAAGVVVATGAGVETPPVGSRVVFHGSFAALGAFAEGCLAEAIACAVLPEGLGFEAAAAMPTAGYTAWLAVIDRFRLAAGESVLIHAGAGGLGGFAVQLARRSGATVLATCSRGNFDHVRALGADHCIDYRSEDIAARVADLTSGRGVDAVLDTLSPQVGAAAIAMLAFQGRLACCTGLPDFALLPPLPRGIAIHDIALGAAYVRGDRRAIARMADYGRDLGALIAAGEVDPMVAEVLPFGRVIEALGRSRTGHQRGKLVIAF